MLRAAARVVAIASLSLGAIVCLWRVALLNGVVTLGLGEEDGFVGEMLFSFGRLAASVPIPSGVGLFWPRMAALTLLGGTLFRVHLRDGRGGRSVWLDTLRLVGALAGVGYTHAFLSDLFAGFFTPPSLWSSFVPLSAANPLIVLIEMGALSFVGGPLKTHQSEAAWRPIQLAIAVGMLSYSYRFHALVAAAALCIASFHPRRSTTVSWLLCALTCLLCFTNCDVTLQNLPGAPRFADGHLSGLRFI